MDIGSPFDLSNQSLDSPETREQGEARARGIIDGRTARRRGRGEPVAFKTTLIKRQQLQRLALRMNTTLTEVIERALDELEKKLDEE